MIFSQYRESVYEITELISTHPEIKAMSFVGQSGEKGDRKTVTQKEQLLVISKFRDGGYNTLVSTCVGEEGLDIGEVDLIICYDSQNSAIRLIQRMGRTGRKREGRIVVLLTEGKEVNSYESSLRSKKNIYKIVQNGAKNFQLYKNNPIMIPKEVKPSCHKIFINPPPSSDSEQETNKKKTKKKSIASNFDGDDNDADNDEEPERKVKKTTRKSKNNTNFSDESESNYEMIKKKKTSIKSKKSIDNPNVTKRKYTKKNSLPNNTTNNEISCSFPTQAPDIDFALQKNTSDNIHIEQCEDGDDDDDDDFKFLKENNKSIADILSASDKTGSSLNQTNNNSIKSFDNNINNDIDDKLNEFMIIDDTIGVLDENSNHNNSPSKRVSMSPLVIRPSNKKNASIITEPIQIKQNFIIDDTIADNSNFDQMIEESTKSKRTSMDDILSFVVNQNMETSCNNEQKISDNKTNKNRNSIDEIISFVVHQETEPEENDLNLIECKNDENENKKLSHLKNNLTNSTSTPIFKNKTLHDNDLRINQNMETSFTEQQIVAKEPVTNLTNRNSIDEIISFVVHQETNELEQENSKEDDLLMEFITSNNDLNQKPALINKRLTHLKTNLLPNNNNSTSTPMRSILKNKTGSLNNDSNISYSPLVLSQVPNNNNNLKQANISYSPLVSSQVTNLNKIKQNSQENTTMIGMTQALNLLQSTNPTTPKLNVNNREEEEHNETMYSKLPFKIYFKSPDFITFDMGSDLLDLFQLDDLKNDNCDDSTLKTNHHLVRFGSVSVKDAMNQESIIQIDETSSCNKKRTRLEFGNNDNTKKKNDDDDSDDSIIPMRRVYLHNKFITAVLLRNENKNN
jgi:superfamily II DNA/RNA helicase